MDIKREGLFKPSELIKISEAIYCNECGSLLAPINNQKKFAGLYKCIKCYKQHSFKE
jgi:DNA-directed RNA polymerase subunit RPC12/RpoP